MVRQIWETQYQDTVKIRLTHDETLLIRFFVCHKWPTRSLKGVLMKFILIVFSLIFFSLSYGAEIKIFDQSTYMIGYGSHISSDFVLNEELGRAWVETTVSSNDPDSTADEYRTKVEGLFFDRNSNSIIINFEGQNIICGSFKIKGKSIFKRRVMVMTKKCTFRGEWKKYSYDNGYEIKKGEKYQVYLVINQD